MTAGLDANQYQSLCNMEGLHPNISSLKEVAVGQICEINKPRMAFHTPTISLKAARSKPELDSRGRGILHMLIRATISLVELRVKNTGLMTKDIHRITIITIPTGEMAMGKLRTTKIRTSSYSL